MQIVIEVENSQRALDWLARAQRAAVLPLDAGLRYESPTVVKVDRHDDPAADWLREPAGVAF